jgi:hypothetical protein
MNEGAGRATSLLLVVAVNLKKVVAACGAKANCHKQQQEPTVVFLRVHGLVSFA